MGAPPANPCRIARIRRQREPLFWHAGALGWQGARDLAELECLGATGSDPRFYSKQFWQLAKGSWPARGGRAGLAAGPRARPRRRRELL